MSKRFAGVIAAKDVTFEVRAGEIHGLIGPNGAGKSTIVNLATGEYSVDKGRVLVNGRDVTNWSPHKRSREGLGRTFQSPQVFSSLTAEENVLVSLEARPSHMTSGGQRRRRDVARTLLAEFALGEQSDRHAGDLPYGMQKRLQLAVAFAHEPAVILLDEPMAGLSQSETRGVMEILKRRRSQWAMLLIEHHMEVIMSMCDVITVVSTGEVIAQGSPEEIRADPQVREAYLGV